MEKMPLHQVLAEILLFAQRHNLPHLTGLIHHGNSDDQVDDQIQMTFPHRDAVDAWTHELTDGYQGHRSMSSAGGIITEKFGGVVYLHADECPSITWGYTLGLNWPPTPPAPQLDDATISGLESLTIHGR